MQEEQIPLTFRTKIHAVVDALGNPIAILLTTGNTADITVAVEVAFDTAFRKYSMIG